MKRGKFRLGAPGMNSVRVNPGRVRLTPGRVTVRCWLARSSWTACWWSRCWAKVLHGLRERLAGLCERRSKSGRGSWLAGHVVEIPLGCYVGCAQERDAASGWAGEEISAHGRWKIWKRFLFFKSFLNFKPIWILIKFEFWWLLFTK
jgi:hypothetical protein